MSDPQAFGTALRRERERRGITLDQIAARTKIAVSLFDGLERGDLTRWPGGIFRRAFIRNYAQAVGLDPEPVVEAFLRACPEDDDDTGRRRPVSPAGAAAERRVAESPFLRLTLADEAREDARVSWRALGGACIDAMAVVLPGVAAWAIAGTGTALAVALGAAVLWPLGGATLLGTTVGQWVTRRRPAAGRPTGAAHTVVGDVLPAAAAPPGAVEPVAVPEPPGEARRPSEAFVSPRRRDRRVTRGAARRTPDGRAGGH